MTGNREKELLLWCARSRLDAGGKARIRGLAQYGVDWTYLLALALSHRVMPLVWSRLEQLCAETVPQRLALYLRRFYRDNARGNLHVAGELVNILNRLDACEVRAIPLNGPFLSAAVYGDLALGQFHSVDVLIHLRDVGAVEAVLAGRGYRGRSKPVGGLRFERNVDKLVLDLRWDLLLGLDRVLEQSQPRDRSRPPGLSAEDSLLFACVDAAGRAWNRLRSISHAAHLLNRYPEMDLARVLKRARGVGAERMVRVGLLLARDLLGAELRLPFRLDSDWPSVLAAKLAQRRFFEDENCTESAWDDLFLQFLVRERTRDRIRFGLQCFRSDRTRPGLAGFQPTPMETVRAMLALAEVGPADVVYDLGCGDGRIPIEAARLCGAAGVGVDSDPRRIQQAKRNAASADVTDSVSFIRQDALVADLRRATVVTLYLPLASNLRLRRKLQNELRPGARVVSRCSDMADWTALRADAVRRSDGSVDQIYLWTI